MPEQPKFALYGIFKLGSIVLKGLLAANLRPSLLITKFDDGPETLELLEIASSANIPCWQPEMPRPDDFVNVLGPLDLDLAVVAGYHRKIPAAALILPRHGTINVHGSLLPAYRGPSTWKHCIAYGEQHTGVTIHTMTPELDRGDIWAQQAIAITDVDTGGSLFEKICYAGAELLPGTMHGILNHTLQARPQDESAATYFTYLGNTESTVNWSQDATSVSKWIRALSPRPGARTFAADVPVPVEGVVGTAPASGLAPGTIASIDGESVRVATATEDLLVLIRALELQPGMVLGGKI